MGEDYAKLKIQEWYHQYNDEIYRYILMMTNDHEQAKDLLHDTFLKAFHYFEDFQGLTSEKNWLYRIARNLTIDYLRKRKPLQYLVKSYSSLASNAPCPQKVVELGEAEEFLYRSLKKLKRSYQEVIFLRKIKGFSIKETAEILSWQEAKVKNTLFRGLAALKKQLEKEGFEHETI